MPQEEYDKIKIFLISNFNITFVPGKTSNIVESFEVDKGKVVGNYHDNSSLSLESESDSGFLDELVQKITELSGIEAESVTQTVDDVAPILEHIQNCDICKAKFSEILSHTNS